MGLIIKLVLLPNDQLVERVMVRETNNLDDFQVKAGHCKSIQEAEHTFINELIERDIDRGITQGREDFANGRYRVMNKENNAAFVSKLANKLLPDLDK
jgi:hypothetical protein